MPVPDPSRTLTFSTPKELSQWLKMHHASENELWVKIYKKATGIKTVTWNDVVIEALCWGWIDGVKKSIDEKVYLQRITPRKARMMESGLVHVRAAKADGRWESAYVVSEIEVPEDFIIALDNKPNAKTFYPTLTKSSRYVIAYGLLSAKKAETRMKRFDKFMNMLANEEKPK